MPYLNDILFFLSTFFIVPSTWVKIISYLCVNCSLLNMSNPSQATLSHLLLLRPQNFHINLQQILNGKLLLEGNKEISVVG